jgi:hypothetical protein
LTSFDACELRLSSPHEPAHCHCGADFRADAGPSPLLVALIAVGGRDELDA